MTGAFQLAATQGGPGLDLSATGGGSHRLSVEGVDFTGAGSGNQNLVVDITAAALGNQKLDGVGGARGLIGAPSGNRVATASASGSGGAIIDVGEADARANTHPRVFNTVGSGAQLTASHVQILTDSHSNAAATASNGGGGLVSVGEAEADADVDNTSRIDIGLSSQITADNVTIRARANNQADTLASSDNEGFGAGVDVDSTTDINFDTKVVLSGQIIATDRIVAESVTRVDGFAKAVADADGFGADSDANDQSGRGVRVNFGNTRTELNGSASLTADRVDLNAFVDRLGGRAVSESDSDALGADADARADVFVRSTTEVTLRTGSTVIGIDLVSIKSEHKGVNVTTRAEADCSCLGGDTDATAITDYDTTSRVVGQDEAIIRTSDLFVGAQQFVDNYDRSADKDGGAFDDGDEDEEGQFEPRREVRWDSTVELLGERSPELVIDATGKVIKKTDNVTVNGDTVNEGDIIPEGTTIVVDDIVYTGSGTATLLTNSLGERDDVSPTAAPFITGSNGLFDIQETFDTVKITNLSDRDLQVNDIDVVKDQAQGQQIDLQADSITILFDIAHSFDPTLVEVQNLGPADPSDIILNGVIENPTGHTVLRNQRGDILASADGDTETVRTNTLEIDADAGSAGTAGQRIVTELIQSTFDPDHNDPVNPFVRRDIMLDAEVAGDLFLDVTAVRRENVAEPFAVDIGPVKAGNNADILVRDSVEETQAVNLQGVQVDLFFSSGFGPLPPDSKVYNFRFRPDLFGVATELGAFGGNRTTIDSDYNFTDLRAGNNISIQHLSTGSIVTFNAFTDVDATLTDEDTGATTSTADGIGKIDMGTNGLITVTEQTGDLRAGNITSTADDVILFSPAGIVDADNDFAADVTGIDVTMTAQTGGIGSAADFLEINSATPSFGVLNADAQQSIFLTETAGDLNVDTVTSTLGDVTLTTRSGSILDGRNGGAGDTAFNVQAADVDLDANGGGIGAVGNDLEIDSSTPTTGRLAVQGDQSIFVTETSGELNVLLAESVNGDVRLTVRETAALGEDLNLLANGTKLFEEDNPMAVDNGLINAAGSVLLRVGDDVTTDGNSRVFAGTTITIRGDFQNTDPGFGTNMDLRGQIGSSGAIGSGVELPPIETDPTRETDLIQVFGHTDVDTVTFHETTLGAKTRVYGSQNATATLADDGEDRFIVNQIQTMHVADGDTLTLDGQADTDTYTVITTGSQGDLRHYLVNTLDTGAKDDGVDMLTIDGSDQDDVFLLRRSSFIPDEVSEAPAFVALLHGTLDQARTPSGDPADRPQEVQRINYDVNINGRLNVFGFGGNDTFATDDNSAITTLDGGAGSDTFQIGQLFGTKRDDAVGNLAPHDVFETVFTTRGFLSPGTSSPLVAQGGSGNDMFSVYSNKAELRLEGDAGNDLFVVRAFALAQTNANGDPILDPEGNPIPIVGDFSTQATTQLQGGGGDDEVQYNINAPVSVDGGSGFDKVVVLGTEFPDDFVISEKGIFGAGVNVRFTTVEVVEVDGLEGDDEFFVISTPFGVSTRVVGGLGSDTINVTGDVIEDITVRELEGRAAAINHQVRSDTDLGFDQLPAPGIDLNVATPETGTVVIEETAGSTLVREAGGDDAYSVRLASPITDATTQVFVTVSAARSSQEEEDQSGDSVLVRTTDDPATFTRTVVIDGVPVEVPIRAVVLVFDASNWDQEQTVFVKAVDDPLAEGPRVVTVSHSTSVDTNSAADRAVFDQVAVRNVEVTVLDNDQPGLIITETDGKTLVLEGDATAGISDTYTVELTKAPAPGTTVTVTLSHDDQQIGLSSPDARFNAAATSITFDPSNWDQPVTVTVDAVDEFVHEDPKVSVITHEVTSTDVAFVVTDQLLDVDVLDNETEGVVVEESDGSTLVIKGDSSGDTYTIRLTKAPVGDVQIAIVSDGQTLASSSDSRFTPASGGNDPFVTFDDTNWFTPVEITLIADDTFVPTPGTESTKTFAAQTHLLSKLRGPLAVEGGVVAGADRSLVDAVILPKEANGPLSAFDVGDQPNEAEQIDVLNIFDDSSQEDKTGVLTATTLTGLNMADELVFEGDTPFGEPTVVPGGISYGRIEIDPNTGEFLTSSGETTIEVFNLVLGEGNNNLTIDSTLVPSDEGGGPATHGGLTVIHGGGNRFLTDLATGDLVLDTNDQPIVGGDTITVNAGAGPDSPLVIYGDTSQDGLWYSGNPQDVSGVVFDVKPFDQAGTEDDSFEFPLASPFDLNGQDVIDASGVFVDADPLPTVGVTIYGGPNNDVIIGTQAGDHLAGGSGDDEIRGLRGIDHIYGDSGFNVDVLTRVLTAPTHDSSADPVAFPPRDDLAAGQDLIYSDFGPTDTVVPATAIDDFDDIVVADHGVITQNVPADVKILTTRDVVVVESAEPTNGDNDDIHGQLGNDILIGGGADDEINGGESADLIFGDHGRVETNITGQPIDRQQLPMNQPIATHPFVFTSIFTQGADGGGNDIIFGDEVIEAVTDGQDIVIGGQGDDQIAGGGADDDLIGGHNIAGGHDGSDVIDGGSAVDAIVGDNASVLRTGTALSFRLRVLDDDVIYDSNGVAQVTDDAQLNPTGSAEREIELFDHSDTTTSEVFGDDQIAGGAEDDVIFGQLGNDIIQGDGATILDEGVLSPVLISVLSNRESVEDFAGTGRDGDDYIEGNGGDDLIFGNLGQDDLIGGSSELFGLVTTAQRPDGQDVILGGAGIRLVRNNLGDLSADGHARDADTILGNNGNLLRLVGTDGSSDNAFLEFTYDAVDPARGSLRVIPRAFELLDYTQGGDPADLGNADLIHGESGDDTIHAMTGNDVVFGEGQDDDIYGGTGHDRIYGGSGIDGVIGDDGKILTSRNGQTEPLNALTRSNRQEVIDTRHPLIGVEVFIDGELHKEVDLVAFDSGGNDIIYGGLGGDFLHAGAGDDAVSGAEALIGFYNEDLQTDLNPLGYDPVTRKLAAYDADNPRTKIDGFLLNFDAFIVDETTGQPIVINGQLVKNDDGKDRIFGDLGHDWIVGGTNFDRMFGGMGDDLINADDNHENGTAPGLNDLPDDPEFADGDWGFGGGGLDVLIANTGADRLFDWVGEFNTFVVPFSVFGEPTVNRLPEPDVFRFLEDLGFASGADQTISEPDGELGLVTPSDPQWLDQAGPPRDPQPGTINGVNIDTQGDEELSWLPTDVAIVRVETAINAANPSNPTADEDADDPTGPALALGTDVVWTYRVLNAGNVSLDVLSIQDDFGTSGDTSDDFMPLFVGGDVDNDNLLDPGEVWLYTSAGIVTYQAVSGQFTNVATVTAEDAAVTGLTVTDDDANNHFGGTPPITVTTEESDDTSGGGNEQNQTTAEVFAVTPITIQGNTLSVDITNQSDDELVLNGLEFVWSLPQLKLEEILVGGSVIFDTTTNGGQVSIDSFIGSISDRVFGADQTHTLTFVFNKSTGALDAGSVGLLLGFSSVLLTVA